MAADLLAKSGPHDAKHLVHLLSRESASLVEWLVDDLGVDLCLITDYKHVGHSVTRLHASPTRKGASPIRDLVAAVKRAGVDIVTGNPVVDLLTDDGRVTGVRVSGERSGTYEIRCHAVVLAANGFGNNKQLLDQWIPEIVGAQYFGAEGSTGEAIEWCTQLGAATANVGAYQGYAAVAYPHGSIVSWTTVEKGGLLLSPDGRRMGDESVGYSAFAQVVSAVTSESWVVMDERICQFVASNELEFSELVEVNGAVVAQDAAEVARVIGGGPDVVAQSLADFAAGARGERLDEFGRTDFGFGPLEPPYRVVRSIPALFHTQGGVVVNEDGAVVGRDSRPIPGLFAGGGVAAGVSGRDGASGYSSGNGLLTAVGLGRIAGRNAARVGERV